MKVQIEFYEIQECPLPKMGDVVVSVTAKHPEGYVTFSDIVTCDTLGPMDKHGDIYMYHKEITHWTYLPAINPSF